MIVTRKALPRRTVLRGAGAALALPFLDAMAPALRATPASPRRLGYIYMPMGAHLPEWTPRGNSAKLDQLSPILQSLAPHVDYLTVVSNLELRNSYPGTHATSNAGFLSAAKAKWTESSDYYLGTTADQLAAQSIGQATRLPSIELAMDLLTVVGQCDNGYACVYQNNLSWASPTTPLPAEAHPRLAFERLFGEGGPAAERSAENRKEASLLDGVREDIARLQKRLGAGDQRRVDQYLSSVREVERRIQMAERGPKVEDLERPIGVPASYSEHAKLMFDLQVLALQADVTRVTTFQLARETSTRTYPEIGITEAHHALTHNNGNKEMLAKVARINAYHVSLFAYFLEKLKTTADGDGNLLDHTSLLYGSGMGNPDIHDHVNLPIIVAGGPLGKQPGGRHIQYREPKPLANLHLTLLQSSGVKIDSFADSQGRIQEFEEPLSL
jgi:hypothetical protein